MPIYEYACQKCNRQFEILVRNGENPSCPDCKSDRLEKQFSIPAAHTSAGQELPVCPPQNCGRPQCGQGGCMGLE